ncbi:MAG: SDR family oxidoreductase [Candidatus Manganitrophus sp.]|nr:SDR family oxidoreductase [Candidatus Manganitrophus sp.]MDC4223264.1 SDR family oxidoreductase [Candidatus Manganitrophus sp.]WDT71634.1 MAG: SDR family oxidoreductase [Candidatus Manganitrophus sp.]WDT76116.1 MAG: SDR family oxidoreductase [Candidatus Manganitrophus sp.]WDT81018.1 MAG: SDR family oxidoreductase [Candidatus Manganitrophus sp.]
MSETIIIIGASSGIAEAVARCYAEQGSRFFLVARNSKKLQVLSTDLTARGAKEVQTFVMDANDTNIINKMLDSAWNAFGAIDIALIAHGSLPDQQRTEIDIPYAIAEFRTNAESVIACLAGLAVRFKLQGKGVITVMGSVAGDRGRASNYLYGAAKASIDAYASGLRARLFKTGVHVLTVKPGFVMTAMTAQLKLPERLTASAEFVARDIRRAISKRCDVLYTPRFWILIMLIIRWMPEVVFKRMRF